jgi:hypothetical protein
VGHRRVRAHGRERGKSAAAMFFFDLHVCLMFGNIS